MKNKEVYEALLITTSLPFGGNNSGHLVMEGVGMGGDFTHCHRTQITWSFKAGAVDAARAVIMASNVIESPITILNHNGKTAFKIPGGLGAHAVVSYIWVDETYHDTIGWTVTKLTDNVDVPGLSAMRNIEIIQGYSNTHEELPVGVPIPWIKSDIPKGFLAYTGTPFNKVAFPKLAALFPSGILEDLRGDFLRAAEVGRAVFTRQGQSVQALGFRGNALPPHAHTSKFPDRSGGQPYLGGQGSYGWHATSSVSAGTPSGSITGTGSETRPRNMGVIFITKAG